MNHFFPKPVGLTSKNPQHSAIADEIQPEVQGLFQAQSFKLDVPATVGWHDFPDISFPFHISLYAARAYIFPEHDGDQFEFTVAPDTIVGAITGDVVVNDNVINVSDSVLENVKMGFKFKLDDGTNNEDLGIVTAINAEAKQITVKNQASQAFSAASPTYVKMSIEMLPPYYFHCPAGHNFQVPLGEEMMNGSLIYPGTVIKARYYNSSTNAKTYVFDLRYRY